MPVYKVSWSGGKDSTAALFLHLREYHSVHIGGAFGSPIV